ncbi:MAG: phage tail tape measure protein [Acetobacter aceti]
MSGSQSLRAQFDLLFNVGPTEGLTQATQVLDRIDQALERLHRAVDPFSEMTEPVARATGATNRLNETLERTTAVSESVTQATAAVREELSGVGAAATSAASEYAAACARMKEASAALAAGTFYNGPSGPGDVRNPGPGLSGRLGAVGRGVSGVSDSINSSMGHAFGAAATAFGLIAPIHAAAEYDNDLTHIGITYGITGAANAPFAKALGQRIDALARETGQRSGELVGAASFLSQEGYSQSKLDSFLPTIARISTAYNSRPDAVAKTAFALSQNFHISDAQLPDGLAMIARVGKESALPFEQLAPLFPDVAATAAQIGVTGLGGVADIASFLAVIRKNVGSEGKATTDLRQVMSTLTSAHGRHRFEKFQGWDPRDVMDAASAAGKDPLSAVMDKIQAIADPVKRRHAISDMFVGMEDQTGASAMTRDYELMMDIRSRIQSTSPEMIQKDYDTGKTSTLIRLNSFEDALTQLERRIGTSFVPTMNTLTKALDGLLWVFDHLDKLTAGWSTTIVGTVGAFLAFTTALGVLKAVCGPLLTGLRAVWAVLKFLRITTLVAEAAFLGLRVAVFGLSLLFAPGAAFAIGIAALVAGLAYGAYYVINHWEKVKGWFSSFAQWIKGIFSPVFAEIGNAFSTIENRIANSSIGHMMGLHGAAPIPAGAAGGGQFGLHVTTDPGVRVRQTAGPSPITAGPDRGRMVNRP